MVLKVELWTPTYQEFQDLFSNDYSLKILSILHQMHLENRTLCAADVAKLLDIHISTAKKYLDLLADKSFVNKEFFPNKQGKPTYYSIKSMKINVNLDLERLSKNIQENVEFNSLPNPKIREKPNLEPRIAYKVNDEGLVTEILVKKLTKAKRRVQQQITLTDIQSAFMKYLPHPTMKTESFQSISKKAGVQDFFNMKMLVPFLDKLVKHDIIEVNNQSNNKTIF